MQSGVERFTVVDILINLGMSFLMGSFIFFIYRKTFQGVLYQRSFNISLVAITMVVTMIIMTISGNLVLSLGMVGALSIVRFRTAIKDPVDLVYIFWAIAVGLGNGVSYFHLTIISSIVLTLVLLLFTRNKSEEIPYLLVMQCDPSVDEDEIMAVINSETRINQVKSKSFNPSYFELTIEVRLKDGNTKFLTQLHEQKKVLKATLVSYSGDLAQV